MQCCKAFGDKVLANGLVDGLNLQMVEVRIVILL